MKPENFCKIQCRADLRYNSLPPACQWFGDHEYICDTIAHIYWIYFFGLPDSQAMRVSFMNCLFHLYIQQDEEDLVWALVYFQHVLYFSTNSASSSRMHHSFTSHSLISFFHNLTNSTVCNVINYFQMDQFIRNCLHYPVGVSICVFNAVISPFLVCRRLIQLQQYLCVLYVITFPTFLY